jgi:hypothetical protein
VGEAIINHKSSINVVSRSTREPLSRMTVNGRFAPVFVQLNTATAVGMPIWGTDGTVTGPVQPVPYIPFIRYGSQPYYFTFVLEEAHDVFEHEYDSILSFFLVHVSRFRVNNRGGSAAIPLCSFFVLITGNGIAPTSAPIQSEPSTARMPPQSIQIQLTRSTNPMDNTQTPPSAGPGAVDSSVIPPSHVARTIILCFGDQLGTDVCADFYSPWSPSTDR